MTYVSRNHRLYIPTSSSKRLGYKTNGPICPSNASSTVAVPAASLASGDGASEIIVFIEYIRQVLTHLNQDEALGRLDRLTDFPKVFGLRLNHSNFCLQCSFCILVVD